MNTLGGSAALPLPRIVVVDDHGIVREGIGLLLGQQGQFDVVGAAATGEQAVLAAQRLRPDVIIMDLVLPALNGIDATQRILRSLPRTKIIILSACRTAEHVYRALRVGARGYVIKDAVGTELVCAVQTVLCGKQYLSPSISAALADTCATEANSRSPLETLSARERDVLHRTVEGYSSVEIGRQLSLSPKTVDTYRSRLMEKLGVADRSSLIRFAIQFAMAPC
jgi:two-component system, NarL family, response regulator NreC